MPLNSNGLQALHDEVENDPAGRGYKESDGTWKADHVVKGLVNEPLDQSPVQGPVPASAVRDLFARNGVIAKMLDSTNDTVRSYGHLLASGTDAGISSSTADSLLQKAVDLGLITSSEKGAVMAEGQNVPTQSRAEVAIGVNAEPTETDVANARSL